MVPTPSRSHVRGEGLPSLIHAQLLIIVIVIQAAYLPMLCTPMGASHISIGQKERGTSNRKRRMSLVRQLALLPIQCRLAVERVEGSKDLNPYEVLCTDNALQPLPCRIRLHCEWVSRWTVRSLDFSLHPQ